MSFDLISETKSYIEQQMHPFALKRAAAITPLICLNCHPFLQKVAAALTKNVARCSLLTLQELEEIGFEQLFANAHFAALLLPLDQIVEHPLLRIKLASPTLHKLEHKLFPLAKIDCYLDDEPKKRDLWEKLKNMPLSS